MLAGIVAMQVEVLKLNASVGNSLVRGAALQSSNEQLRASVASLADDQRIMTLAASMGMIMPAPDQIGFLSGSGGRDVQRAIADIHVPDPSSFLSLTTTNGAIVTAASAAAAAGDSAGGSAAGTQSTPTNTPSPASGGQGSNAQGPATAQNQGATPSSGTGGTASGQGTSPPTTQSTSSGPQGPQGSGPGTAQGAGVASAGGAAAIGTGPQTNTPSGG